MIRISISIMISIIILSFGSSSFAWDREAFYKKFKRGTINIVTSPLEIPKQAKASLKEEQESEKTKHKPIRIFSGLVKGIANTALRAGSGVVDVLTFSTDLPDQFEPMFKPDYVSEKFDR